MRTLRAKEVSESLRDTTEEPSRGLWARMTLLSGSSGTFLDNWGRWLREQINGHASPPSQLHPHFIPRPKVITVHSLLTPQKEEGQALNLESTVYRLPQTSLLKAHKRQQHLP